MKALVKEDAGARAKGMLQAALAEEWMQEEQSVQQEATSGERINAGLDSWFQDKTDLRISNEPRVVSLF